MIPPGLALCVNIYKLAGVTPIVNTKSSVAGMVDDDDDDDIFIIPVYNNHTPPINSTIPVQ
jgi:hypothetical protein